MIISKGIVIKVYVFPGKKTWQKRKRNIKTKKLSMLTVKAIILKIQILKIIASLCEVIINKSNSNKEEK